MRVFFVLTHFGNDRLVIPGCLLLLLLLPLLLLLLLLQLLQLLLLLLLLLRTEIVGFYTLTD